MLHALTPRASSPRRSLPSASLRRRASSHRGPPVSSAWSPLTRCRCHRCPSRPTCRRYCSRPRSAFGAVLSDAVIADNGLHVDSGSNNAAEPRSSTKPSKPKPGPPQVGGDADVCVSPPVVLRWVVAPLADEVALETCTRSSNRQLDPCGVRTCVSSATTLPTTATSRKKLFA